MNNDRTASVFSEDGTDLYPHMKITAEAFPRILATRRVENDGAEYFGAFLSKTSVRILIDFLNRTFRLRSCDIDIDGGFPVPCTQFYRKRCLAPCVKTICDRDAYLEMVGLARLFLSNQRELLLSELNRHIRRDSENLDFESAADWRDILLAVENFWQNSRLQVWLDDTTDTFVTDETVAGEFIYLATQRRRQILGRKVFRIPRGGGMSPDEALRRIIESFYVISAPKEIRVSIDFENRIKLARELSERFRRPLKIVVTRPDRNLITSMRALRTARDENELDFVKERATPRQISGELKRMFSLDELPTRVEAFDVAHISGKSFVAAWSVWDNGKYVSDQYGIHVSGKSHELAALSDSVARRLRETDGTIAGLILLDGGKPQMNATLTALGGSKSANIRLVGAVKPAGQHSSVSYFLTENAKQIVYEPDNPAQNMLRLLRDDAHDLANRAHRDLRDMVHHYELPALLPSVDETTRRKLLGAVGSIRKIRELDNSILHDLLDPETAGLVSVDLKKDRSGESEAAIPFIVPIRYVAENGDAEDLRPIAAR